MAWFADVLLTWWRLRRHARDLARNSEAAAWVAPMRPDARTRPERPTGTGWGRP